MGEDFVIINYLKAMEELEEVETRRKEVEKNAVDTIRKIDEEQTKAFMTAVSQMQSVWHATERIFSTLGMAFPKIMRTIISGSFAAIKTITAVLTAAELTPGMQIQATLGLIQIGFSMAAAIAAQKEEKIAQERFNDVNSILGTVNGLIGSFSW